MDLRCLLLLAATIASQGADAAGSLGGHPANLFGPPVTGPAATPAPTDPNLLDQVRLINHQTIVGTILPSSGEQSLDVNTGSGMVRIPRDQVDDHRTVYGLTSRRAKMATESLPDLLEFAAWCQDHGYKEDALQALDRATTLPGASIEVLGMQARLLDETGGQAGTRRALALYRRYQAGGGQDSEILARLAQLETVVQAHNRLLADQGLAPEDFSDASGSAASAPNTSHVGAVAHGGLETKGWQPEEIQWSLPVTPTVVALGPEDGGIKVLSVVSPGKPGAPPASGKTAPEKAALKRSVDIALDDNSVISFQIRNRGPRPLSVAVAVKTSDQWKFYESLQQQVVPGDGFKELKYDLRSKTFKSEATKWAPTGQVQDLDQIKEMQLLIYNGGSPVELQIHSMQLVKNSEM